MPLVWREDEMPDETRTKPVKKCFSSWLNSFLFSASFDKARNMYVFCMAGSCIFNNMVDYMTELCNSFLDEKKTHNIH